jgi:LCP family protein required for cell wall assembly
MILAHFDPGAHRVVLLSLPRDTYVQIPGRGEQKLNAANRLEGPGLSQQTAQQLLGISIDRYALFNVFAVREVVDQLGGVEVYVPQAMNYDDQAAKLHIHFEAGQQHLDGAQSVAFLRFRHDALGDIGRVQRQQAFLNALLAKISQPSAWLQAPQVLGLLNANLHSDLTPQETGSLAGFMASKPEVVRLLLPGSFWVRQGFSYWKMDEAKARALVGEYFFNQPPEQTSSARTTIAVRGERKAALEALRRLRSEGFSAFWDQQMVEAPQQSCLISDGKKAGAQTAAKKIGLACVEVSGTGSLYADYTLVLGPEGLNNPG